jgi:hypothetical protein
MDHGPWTGGAIHLERLDVSNTSLTNIPVVTMSAQRKLTWVNYENLKLAPPPAEIAKQGAEAVARYILDLEAGAEGNVDVHW